MNPALKTIMERIEKDRKTIVVTVEPGISRMIRAELLKAGEG